MVRLIPSEKRLVNGKLFDSVEGSLGTLQGVVTENMLKSVPTVKSQPQGPDVTRPRESLTSVSSLAAQLNGSRSQQRDQG